MLLFVKFTRRLDPVPPVVLGNNREEQLDEMTSQKTIRRYNYFISANYANHVVRDFFETLPFYGEISCALRMSVEKRDANLGDLLKCLASLSNEK